MAELTFPRSSPYWPVVTAPGLRRVLTGLAVSALGDGMALVAVSWLALQLAPGNAGGIWVGAAVASYSLPAVAGAAVFGRWMRQRSGAQLVGWNATLRAGALGTIAVAYGFGALSIGGYIALLAVSSLLSSWGTAGRYTMIAELLDREHHLPANALMTVINEFATIVGPPLAGVLITWHGAAVVIALDAASFTVLAVTYRFAMPPAPAAGAAPAPAAGLRPVLQDRRLLGLLGLIAAFLFLFGPLYVAMPVHVRQDMHASSTVLSAYFTAFGIGAVCGAVVTGYLKRWPLAATAAGTVILFGVSLLPVGLGAPTPVVLASFVITGASWAPFLAVAMALLQRRTPAESLPRVMAANGSIMTVAVPVGTLAGGLLVTAIGARSTMLVCAAATIALGLSAAALLARLSGAQVMQDR